VRDVRHARDDEENAEHAGQKARPDDEQSERQKPETPEDLDRQDSIGVQVEEEHRQRVSLRAAESGQLRANASDPAGLDASWLAALPQAIRARVLRDAAIMAGCPHGALTAGHVDGVDALVTAWRGQRWVDLPGGVRARRRDGKVWFTSSTTEDGGKPVGRT